MGVLNGRKAVLLSLLARVTRLDFLFSGYTNKKGKRIRNQDCTSYFVTVLLKHLTSLGILILIFLSVRSVGQSDSRSCPTTNQT